MSDEATKRQSDEGQSSRHTPCAVSPLPCPFCGSNGQSVMIYKGAWIAQCSNGDCPVQPETFDERDTEAEAIAAWNRRTPSVVSSQQSVATELQALLLAAREAVSLSGCENSLDRLEKALAAWNQIANHKSQIENLRIDLYKDLPRVPEHGILQIAIERSRQIRKGWTPEHDDQHTTGFLLDYARELLGDATDSPGQIALRTTLCVKAGALITAEIDRLHRATQKPTTDCADSTDQNPSASSCSTSSPCGHCATCIEKGAH